VKFLDEGLNTQTDTHTQRTYRQQHWSSAGDVHRALQWRASHCSSS